MIRILALIVFILPGLATAQSYPVHESTLINDYAAVLDEAAENRISNQLQALRDELGVEATVLTLHTRSPFQTEGSLEDFATGLFNDWGIGDATRNDGILILVLTGDRDMRIELGAGYGREFNRAAKYIIDYEMIPHFKDSDFATGISVGTARIAEWIARPHAAGDAPPEETQGGGGFNPWWIFGLFGAGFAGLITWSVLGQTIRDRMARCPKCDQRGINTHREELAAASTSQTGKGEKTVTCSHCGYRNTSSYVIARRSKSSSSSGGFGGGRSSGGGASGSW